VLEVLGLSRDAELAYADLVAAGEPDVAAVVRERTGDAAAGVLAELEVKGLIAPRPGGGPGGFRVAPPAPALEALLAEHRHALHQAELTAAALGEAYRAGTAADGSRDLVEVVGGTVAIRHRFEQLHRGAAREVLALVTGGPQMVRGDETDAEDRAVDRGVAYRVVLERAALEAPGAARLVADALDRNQRVRVAQRVPTKLVIADGGCALVPLTEAAALVVRAPFLLALLIGVFEDAWGRAQPVRFAAAGAAPDPQDPAADGPDTLDLRVLSLLLIGSTDAAIANQLGLGLRTVQRRIKHLMDLAGVATRIQLGWQARDRGWIRA
jgi:sugar-specific transcriptional regulator TrmB